MKKYFMKGTDDELQFGDVIELDLVGEEDGVKKHTHLECKFCPELVDELLKEDVIEVEDIKEKKSDKKNIINFDDEDLEKKVIKLEDRVTELEGIVADLMDELEIDE